MAPTNGTSEGCNLPSEGGDGHSPKLTASSPNNRMQDVSTISSNYTLPTGPKSEPQTQLEIEENPTRRYKLCSKPCSCNHDLKKYLQSLKALPGKTKQSLRVLGVALIAVVVLVAILYATKQSKKHQENVILEHDLEGKLLKNVGKERSLNDQKLIDYDLEAEDAVHRGYPHPPKILKDHNGKAHFYDEEMMLNALRFPAGPPHPKKGGAGASFDRIRNKIRKGFRHPANATELTETLNLVRRIVDADRKLISNKELKFWETGSEPLRVLLLSTWRSGSTFLGQILQSHPGVFEHYEPFSYNGIRQIRSGKEAFQAQQTLHRLLDCQYDGLDAYNNYTRENVEHMIGYNKRVWQACKEGPTVMACADPKMLEEACKMFPIQLVKSVRLRLNITQLLLNDHKLNVKVIFLVRDPRATMSSRYSSVSWCSPSTDCSSPDALCQDLQDDLKVAAAFEKLYPNRFLKVQYEDLSINTDREVRKIVDYLGLEYVKDMKMFVANHTDTDFNKPWSISRKSVDRVSLWKKQLPLEEIHAVQNACESVLKSMKLEIL